MGVVYRAEHGKTGDQVALKTVVVPLARYLAGIRREIHALARIRHPSVVRIVDQGQAGGLPWYAMELLGAQSLRDIFDQISLENAPILSDRTRRASRRFIIDEESASHRWWTDGIGLTPDRPGGASVSDADRGAPNQALLKDAMGLVSDLKGVLTLVRRICAPLAFLHGEGIVHGDLKPGNVLVRPGGRPVLVDFGLARRFRAEFGRDALVDEPTRSGTVGYMSPEQMTAESIDARSDLYSLGCILYELLTHRLPFVSEDTDESVFLHLNAGVPPPSTWVDGIPPELDALTLQLLEKQPENRIAYAVDVAAELAKLGAERVVEDERPPPRMYLYRPRFAGRWDVVGKLQRPITNLENQCGGLVLIGGESGVGKTRLAREVGALLRLRRVTVVTGECAQAVTADPTGTSASLLHPFRPLLQTIADHCRESGLAETERMVGEYGKLLAAYEPAFADLPGQKGYPAPERLSPDAARFRLFDCLLKVLARWTEQNSFVLFLDDLQWADELTLAFLEHVGQSASLQQLPLMIGLYRVEEINDGLKTLLETKNVKRLLLSRLLENAVGEIVGDIMAMRPPDALVSFLSKQSEGNPFYIAEFFRTAIEENLLTRVETGRWTVSGERELTAAALEALPLPGSIRALVDRRLAMLSENDREAVEIASVAGRDFTGDLLTVVMELTDSEWLSIATTLLNRQLVEISTTGQFRFSHDKTREVAYDGISQPRRKRLHCLVAQYLQSHPAQNAATTGVLGRHWENAEESERAQICYLEAARAAVPKYALAEAADLYESYLRLNTQPTLEGIVALNEYATDVLAPLGRTEEVIQRHTQALLQAETLKNEPLQARSHLELASIFRVAGQFETAAEHCEHAIGLQKKLGDRREEAIALGELAAVCGYQSRYEEAREKAEKAIGLLQTIDAPKEEAKILNGLGIVHLEQGRIEEARKTYQAALEIFEKLCARRETARIQGNLGVVAWNLRQWPVAQQHFEKALAIHKEIHDRPQEGWSLNTLACSLWPQGEPNRALDLYLEALGILKQVRNIRFVSDTYRRMAELVRLAQGDLEQAETYVAEAEAIYEEQGNVQGMGFCLRERGHIALARGQSVNEILKKLDAIAEDLAVGAKSEFGCAIHMLRNANEATRLGKQLVRGCCLEDLPEGFRGWLVERGYAPAT